MREIDWVYHMFFRILMFAATTNPTIIATVTWTFSSSLFLFQNNPFLFSYASKI